jgi:ABC-type protease/lipase transport system fused ATPase/permease subunit
MLLHLARRLPSLWVALFFSLFINLLALTFILYMRLLFDKVMSSQRMETLVLLTLAAVAAYAVSGLLESLRSKLLTRTGVRYEQYASRRVFARMLGDSVRAGAPRHTQALTDIESVRNFLGGAGITAFFDAPWVPIYILVVFLFHPLLGLIAVVGGVLLLVLVVAQELGTKRLEQARDEAAQASERFVSATTRNLQSINAMGMLPALTQRWRTLDQTEEVLQDRIAARAGLYRDLAKAILMGTILMIMSIGTYLVISNAITLGTMIAASMFMGRGLAPLLQLGNAWDRWQSARLAYQRLQPLLSDPAPNPKPADPGLAASQMVFTKTSAVASAQAETAEQTDAERPAALAGQPLLLDQQAQASHRPAAGEQSADLNPTASPEAEASTPPVRAALRLVQGGPPTKVALDKDEPAKDDNNALAKAVPATARDGLRVSGLALDLDKRPVLRAPGFHLPPGQILGVVGPNGSGKSTLARVLLGLWAPDQGQVLLDGEPLLTAERESLGPRLGYLPQNIALFNVSVAENIARLGAVDSPAVVAAAQLAGAHAMILNLPDGYDTVIGVNHVNISGGQRQRVALARALYHEPDLVVLDEPDSHLDQAGAAALRRALEQLRQRGASVVVISHHPELLATVDQVLDLANGSLQPPARQQARAAPGGSA